MLTQPSIYLFQSQGTVAYPSCHWVRGGKWSVLVLQVLKELYTTSHLPLFTHTSMHMFPQG